MKKNILSTFLVKVICCFCLLICKVSDGPAADFVFSPLNTSHGLSDNQIRYILQLPDGRMVFTTSGNVNIYDGVGFKYIHRRPRHISSLKQYDGHYHIYQSKDSLLWIKDQHKLMCIDLRRERYVPNPDSIFIKKGVNTEVEDFFMDDEQNMWLLTSHGLWQPERSIHLDIAADQGRLQDLMSSRNRLYLFYHTGVVACYDLDSGQKLYSRAAYEDKDIHTFQRTSLVVKGKSGFYQLRNGSKGGFFFFNPETKAWKTLLETDYALNTLIITPDEKAYISCAKGVWIINPASGEQQYFPGLKTIEGDTVSTHISTLFYDRQGALWIGTFNRGLLYYHPSRYTFKQIGRSAFVGSLPGDMVVHAFAEDMVGKIYVRCGSGIYQYQKEAGQAIEVNPSTLPKELLQKLYRQSPTGFRNKEYTALCTDSRGWTWAGTADGLELYQSDSSTPRVIYTDEGLANNFVHAILEDSRQQIWITTSRGITKIRIDSTAHIHFTNFNTYDGTLAGEYTGNAAFEGSDGSLYFGGVDGFNILPPGHPSPAALPFHPIVSTFRLHGAEVSPGKTYNQNKILTQVAPFTKEITLSHHQNFLNFEYSALNYINPAQTIYRYRLQGIDQDWVSASASPMDGILSITYTNLQPGIYRLQVRAANQTGEWTSAISEFKIIILPPWWRTPLAYASYIFSFLLISTGAIYLYIRHTRQKLEQRHKEEILLLRIRNLIEQRNSYEETLELKQAAHQDAEDEEKSLSWEPQQSPADIAFLNKAMEQVEKHLDVPGYSVEQLSRDLCMERTGLYRKLIALLDESPTLFIRNIRLRRAAQLIMEGKLTIAEVTERVGFSSASYLSKCFQEMYGCRPSEYANQQRNQPE